MAVYKAGFPLKNKFIKERARFYNLNLKPVVINDFEIYSK
jgi:hypothetical protein